MSSIPPTPPGGQPPPPAVPDPDAEYRARMGEGAVPPFPIWTGDIEQYRRHLDIWAAEMHCRCRSAAFQDWYRQNCSPPPSPAPPPVPPTDLAKLSPPEFAARLSELPPPEQRRLRELLRVPPAASESELVRLLRGLEENPAAAVALTDVLREAAQGGGE